MPFEKTTIQILFIIDSILLQSDSGHRLSTNEIAFYTQSYNSFPIKGRYKKLNYLPD
jgi:hypothetical protein